MDLKFEMELLGRPIKDRSRHRVAGLALPNPSMRYGSREPPDGDCAFWWRPLKSSRSKFSTGRASSFQGIRQLPHASQLKVASETEAHDFDGGLATALVGRVSPRPQD
jgi:hypothetical protein